MSQQWPNYYGQPAHQYPTYNSQANEWHDAPQPIRSSWADPRFNTQTTDGQSVPQNGSSNVYAQGQNALGSPVSPIQAPLAAPYSSHDTTTWGVRYNQQYGQDDGPRPPLPPRPGQGQTGADQTHLSYSQPYNSSWQHPHEQYADHLATDQPPHAHPPPAYEQFSGPDQLPPPPPLPPSMTAGQSPQLYGSHTDPSSRPSTIQARQDVTEAVQPPPPPSRPDDSYFRPPPPPPRPPKDFYMQSHSPPVPYNHSSESSVYPSPGQQGSGMGTYQTQSPPPIADYNLSVPWSDPVPLMSPVASLPEEQRPLDTPNPTHNSFELNAVQSPIDSDQPHDSWPSGEPNSSKVSEDKSPGSQPQTVEGRRQSRASSISPLPGIQRTGTIDDVIQAWTKPIQPDQPVTNSTPWDDPGFAPVLRQLSKLVKTNDPYQDLPSESRASLERFVSMLRKESEAESDKEKFEVFSAFVQKETRLRAVLYGHDPNPLQPHKASKDGDKSAQETSPGEHDVNPSPPTQAAAENHASETQDSYNDRSPATPKFRDDSYVVVNQDHGPANDPQELPAEVKTSTPEPSVTTPVQSGKVARMLQDTIEAPQEHSAEAVPAFKPRPLSADAPILVEPEPDLIPPKATNVASNDPHVANSPPPSFSRANKPYRPFQYQVLPNRGSSQYTMQTASTQSYAALRKANSGSGRTTIIPPMSMNQSYPRLPTRQEQAEAFLGLVRQRSENEGRTMSLTGSKSDIISPHRGIDADLEAIRRIVPETLPSYIESPELTKIRFSLKDIPDEFSFIHAAVLKWNRGVLERKKRNDSERHRRQEEAERNIDALFNDNQIGYADIATLEAENRAEEAKIATGEEMEDVQTFVKEVFEVVSGTIQGQLNSLAQVYSEAMTLVESQSVSGSQFIRKPSSRTALPQAMDTLLVIYSKMQVRHQKLLEAALERSRRTRKARVTGLRAEGKAAEAQDCEISLLKEEQDMIIDAKEKDDDRANFLMDTFDKMAVLRGLAENQNFVDELHPSLRTIATTLETNVSTYDYDILRSILLSTQSALDFITADSISILKFSSIADEILNNADYDVSVAKAYRNDASPQEFKALEREKVKEDQNIKAEMAAKVEGMSSGSREVQDLVKNLLDKLEESPDHKKRLEEALERAKKRNAEAKIG